MKLLKDLSNLQLDEMFTATRSLHSSPMQRTVRRWMGLSDQDNKAAAHSLGIPGALEQKLTTAGFLQVEVHPLKVPVRMSSAAECVDYLQHTSPTLRELLLPFSSAARRDAWQAAQSALSGFETPSGFEVFHRVLVAAGSRP